MSLNVKGLNLNVKRRLLLTDLKSFKANIVFIQVTHLVRAGIIAFTCRLYPTVFVSSQVAILMSQSCPIQITESIIDPQGHYVILQTTYRGIPLILCNVYVPNVV